jgi:hypothetical protein
MPFAAFLDICLLVPLVVFDVTTLKRKLHPATIRGAVVIFAAQAVLFSLWGTTAWRHFAYALYTRHDANPVLLTVAASSGLLLWEAERNHLPIFFRLRRLFPEADRYKEFNDRRHKSPHTRKNKAEAKKFSF